MDVSFEHKEKDKKGNKIRMIVKFSEQIEGLPCSAYVTVWAPISDSRSELEARAKSEVNAFLKRALEAQNA